MCVWVCKGCLHVDVEICTRVSVLLVVSVQGVPVHGWVFAHLCVSLWVCMCVQGVLARGCGVLHQGFCADCEFARWAFARGCGVLHACLCAGV